MTILINAGFMCGQRPCYRTNRWPDDKSFEAASADFATGCSGFNLVIFAASAAAHFAVHPVLVSCCGAFAVSDCLFPISFTHSLYTYSFLVWILCTVICWEWKLWELNKGFWCRVCILRAICFVCNARKLGQKYIYIVAGACFWHWDGVGRTLEQVFF